MKYIFCIFFCLSLLQCNENGTEPGDDQIKLDGTWGICADSINCSIVKDDGYHINNGQISRIEINGYENSIHHAQSCGKCFNTAIDTIYTETLSTNAFARDENIINFASGNMTVSIEFFKNGSNLKVVTHLLNNEGLIPLAQKIEIWTKLSSVTIPL